MDGERHASLLTVSSEELERQDLCGECWDAHEESEQDLFWWFTRHELGRKKTLSLDLPSMERLFLQLGKRDEEPLRELHYLLALMLMRKRRLKLLKVLRGAEGESMIVGRPRRTETHEVWVREFEPDRMDELRGRLMELIDGAPAEEEGEASELDASEAGPGEGTSDAEVEEAASSGEDSSELPATLGS